MFRVDRDSVTMADHVVAFYIETADPLIESLRNSDISSCEILDQLRSDRPNDVLDKSLPKTPIVTRNLAVGLAHYG